MVSEWTVLCVCAGVLQFTVPGWPHELVGGFLSILLVFRTDQVWISRERAHARAYVHSYRRFDVTCLTVYWANTFFSLSVSVPVSFALTLTLSAHLSLKPRRTSHSLTRPRRTTAFGRVAGAGRPPGARCGAWRDCPWRTWTARFLTP
jgi:hypothetical protein